MSPAIAFNDSQSASLRLITSRLTSTPIHHLPHFSSQLATRLISCQQLLSASHDDISKEDAALLHSFKTRLSTLLQDRTVEGRWTAVILLKSTVELGGSELLLGDKERCAAWIRGLIGILHKPDPSTTKKLCIITVTRIFILTRDQQTLTRELTTPSLPPFINACLTPLQSDNIFEKAEQRALLESTLESLIHLIPRHPTIFRSFQSKIRTIALQILSRDSDSLEAGVLHHIPFRLRELAQKTLVQLHLCAQKSGSAEEWNLAVRAVVASTHETADQVFRATIEDWESVAGVRSTLEAGQTLTDQPKRDEADQVGLAGWVGIRSGTARILTLMGLLQQSISTSGTAAVTLRVGVLLDLLTRLMYMRVPLDRHRAASRFNNQISRNEREELWSVLPSIHVAAIEVFVSLIQRLGDASNACQAQLLDLLPWLFESEKSDKFLRTAVYKATATVVTSTGPALPKSAVSSLEEIMQACCSDLMPRVRAGEALSSTSTSQNGNKSGQQNGLNADNNSNSKTSNTAMTSQSTTSTHYPGLYEAAYNLLPILLSKLPAQHVPSATRTELDRVAVLLQHSTALAASILNPSPYKPSLLPIMAKIFPESLEVEGLLRPRMPVLRTSSYKKEEEEEEDQEAASEEESLLEVYNESSTIKTIVPQSAKLPDPTQVEENEPTVSKAEPLNTNTNTNDDNNGNDTNTDALKISNPTSTITVEQNPTTTDQQSQASISQPHPANPAKRKISDEEKFQNQSSSSMMISPKRTRHDTRDESTSLPTQTSTGNTKSSYSLVVEESSQEVLVSTGATEANVAQVRMDVDMDDDDDDDDSDGSDFVIPKLELREDSDEDSEDDR